MRQAVVAQHRRSRGARRVRGRWSSVWRRASRFAAALILAMACMGIGSWLNSPPAHAAWALTGVDAHEFFADTFSDPLDFTGPEDVAFVAEGPMQGVTSMEQRPGTVLMHFGQVGYFSPLWAGYEGSAGHAREGQVRPIDASAGYDTLQVRLRASGDVSLGVFFYTCPSGVKDDCAIARPFAVPGGQWVTFTTDLPHVTVTGIRIAIASPAGSSDVEFDSVQVYAKDHYSPAADDPAAPVAEVLNPDVAGAVPYLFPNTGDPLPYRSAQQTCTNTDWSTTVRGDPWDFQQPTDLAAADNYQTSGVSGGLFDGVGSNGVDGQKPGDPGIRLNLSGKKIDPTRYHRVTIRVPSWDGTYSQQFGGNGGWVARALWKFGTTGPWQVSRPLVEYPNDRTITFDLNDANPFDMVAGTGLGVADPTAPGQVGWGASGQEASVFRLDLAEPYRDRHTPLDEVLLATDDCAGPDGAEIMFRDANWAAGTSATIHAKNAGDREWTEIGKVADVVHGVNRFLWPAPPDGTYFIKVTLSRTAGGSTQSASAVSTGPVVIGGKASAKFRQDSVIQANTNGLGDGSARTATTVKSKPADVVLALRRAPDGSASTVRECTVNAKGCDPDPSMPFTVVANPAPAPGQTASVHVITLANASATELSGASTSLADNPSADYRQVDQVLQFTHDKPIQTVNVRIFSDDRKERNERINVSIESPRGATIAPGAQTAFGTISDDDDLVATIGVDGHAATGPTLEGSPKTRGDGLLCPALGETGLDRSHWTGNCVGFFVTLEHPSDHDVPVAIVVEPVGGHTTAEDGPDFDGGVFSAVIPAHERVSSVVAVRIVADAVYEERYEAFRARIAGVDGESVAVGTAGSAAIAVIQDDDPAPPKLSAAGPGLFVRIQKGVAHKPDGSEYVGYAKLASADDVQMLGPGQSGVIGLRPNLVVNGAVRLISNDGASLISNDGASLISNDGGSIISNDGASLISNDGGSLIALRGATVYFGDGFSKVGVTAISVISTDGSALVRLATDGSKLLPPTSLIIHDAAVASLISTLSAQIRAGAGNIISNDGASLITVGLLSNNLSALQPAGPLLIAPIISENGGGIISENGGGIVSTSGSGFVNALGKIG